MHFKSLSAVPLSNSRMVFAHIKKWSMQMFAQNIDVNEIVPSLM